MSAPPPTFTSQAPSHAASPSAAPTESKSIREDEVEDLGFGNSSLRKVKSAMPLTDSQDKTASASATTDRRASDPDTSASGAKQASEVTQAKNQSATPDAEKKAAGGSRSIFGGIGSWLFMAKPKQDENAPAGGVPKAFLPTGNSLYYDNDLKRWVNKGADASAEAKKELAPPPIVPSPE
eukprot:jgi/Hompol1/1059/HPOL_005500-RA